MDVITAGQNQGSCFLLFFKLSRDNKLRDRVAYPLCSCDSDISLNSRQDSEKQMSHDIKLFLQDSEWNVKKRIPLVSLDITWTHYTELHLFISPSYLSFSISCRCRDALWLSLWPFLLGSYGSRLRWARPAQPVDNPTTSSPPWDRLTSFLLCPRSLPFSLYLRSAPLPSTLRESPSAIPNPRATHQPPPPLKSPSLLPSPCLYLTSRKQQLQLYLTSCCKKSPPPPSLSTVSNSCACEFLAQGFLGPDVCRKMCWTCHSLFGRVPGSHSWGCIFSDSVCLDT